MTQQHKDILTIIERHGPISTSEICEYLSTLGYGGAMAWQDFRGSVSKQLCYLRDKGDIAGEDRPQAKGKPMRVWALAKVQEMASDVAEVEAVTEESSVTVQESLTVAEAPETFTDTWTTPIDSVEFKAAVRLTPISVHEALANFDDLLPHELNAFLRGIEFAEKHHGISQ